MLARQDLPREQSQGPLTFAQLIEVLDAIVGERIVCVPAKVEASGGGLEVAGILRRLDSAGGPMFALGNSAWLTLDERDFRSAALSTMEGNTHFVITIELQNNTLVIGDDALMGSDRSDPTSPWNRDT